LISRQRLHRANQVAEKAYNTFHNPEYFHSYFMGYRGVKRDPRLFGMYRKTRVFVTKYACNCWYCVRKYECRSKQYKQSNINYATQVLYK